MNKLLAASIDADAPKCKTLPHIRKYQNQNYSNETVDNYAWLEEKNNSEVIDYLEAENKYTEEVMKSTKALQGDLFSEIKSRIQENDQSAPWQLDQYLYYIRTEAGKEYSIFCRKLIDSQTATEEILLDENVLAHGYDFFDIGDIEISPCHKFLAYTVDTNGNECYDIYLKYLPNQKTAKLNFSSQHDHNINLASEIMWSADSKNILYLRLDDTLRPFEVWCCDINTQNLKIIYNNPAHCITNCLIYKEPDERFRLSVDRTRSDKYLLITSSSHVSTEIYYLPAKNVKKHLSHLRSIKPRAQNTEYSVDHYYESSECNYFYVLLNNIEKPNYELFRMQISSNSWECIIKHNEFVQLECLECFANYAVLFTKENGLTKLHIINNYDFKNIKTLDLVNILSEDVYELSPGDNEMYHNKEYIFEFESFITPAITYAINPRISEPDLRIIKADQAYNFNKSNYVTQRIFIDIKNSDHQLPISIVYNKHAYQQNGKCPLLLYGYGSYGISIDTYFSYGRLSLLDRGIAFAIAHVRGGGELGDKWHYDGRLDCKLNTFDDFILATEHLIQNKYTNSNKLVIHGGSAGGLLIGNVINQRPELYYLAIAEVPFVDCLNTMLDPSLPLTIPEYEEWGNPTESSEVFKYIKSYAPYENISEVQYPNLLINNSLNDTRVGYWEAAKWTAKLRTIQEKLNGKETVTLLNTRMNAGHSGVSGRYQAIQEAAFNYSFIISCLGLTY